PWSQPPSWERAVDSDEFDDDDDVSDGESQSHFSPFSSSDSRARRAAAYSHYFGGDRVPVSSSPVSLCDNALQLEEASPFEEEDASELRAEEPKKLRRHSRRRSVESKRKEEVAEPERDDDEQLAGNDEDEEHVESIPHVESGGDYVPSCTHSLRRQWQTLTLRIRFGVFHAKQRLRRSLRH
ncbi:hypothetical protein EIP91_004314, partial [Steccherinum ochraceum]